ncbi:MAG: META domain-containing protein [Chitinophagaceae bacterium]
MKLLSILITAAVFFAGCSTTKKVPQGITVINPGPAKTTPIVVNTEKKPTKPVITSNPNMKMTSLTGRWKFESSSEKDFEKADRQTLPELNFNESERRVSGNTGCNIFNGFFFTTGELFNFSPLAVKMKKCPDPSVERYITGFLRNVGFYKTEGDKVYLINKNDRSRYVVFTKSGR